MRIAVLSPHRDDAAFSLSLSINTWLHQGHTVSVLNCFTESEYAPYIRTIARPPCSQMITITTLRHLEDERWTVAMGGAIQHTNLGLQDAPLRLDCSANEVCGLPPMFSDPAPGVIRYAVESQLCDTLVLPLALGGHVDHLTVRNAGSGLSQTMACLFYEDLPYAGRPGIYEDISRVAYTVDRSLKPMFVDDAPRDSKTVLHWKKQMVLCYDSQVDDALADEIVAYGRRYNGRERVWANEVWRQSNLTAAETTG